MQEVTNRPEIWTTFNKREIPVAELDHQHLSNIYWFHILKWKERLNWIVDEIRQRFNGQVLQYKPHTEYSHEMDFLENSGYLSWRNSNPGDQIRIGEIIFEGNIIGTIWQFLS